VLPPHGAKITEARLDVSQWSRNGVRGNRSASPRE